MASSYQQLSEKGKYELLAEIEPARKEPGKPSRSPVYVAAKYKDAVIPADETLTLYASFSKAVEKYSQNDCLGARKIEDGTAGDFEYWSYAETADLIAKVASGMKSLGVKRGSRVGVYAINSREWMLTMQACNRMSYICVPIYDSLGENAVEYIINHSESCIAFADAKHLPKLVAALPGVKGFIKNVVYWGAAAEEATISSIKSMKVGIHSFDELMEMEREMAPADPPNPEDLSTIMYTSGTTGDPKGVALTHKSVSSEIIALLKFTNDVNPLGEDDVYISYLPLAHIFDRMGEETILHVGGKIGYWQGNMNDLVTDIATLKPTFFVGVPRVFDRLYSRIKEGVSQSSFLKKMIFRWGFDRKSQALKNGISYKTASPFFDMLVFNKIKDRLGGRVRLIVTGGAPIAPHTEEFVKVCFCAPVVQGYGLTETCAGTFITIPDDSRMDGTVGPPLPFAQFCLESVPDMNYDANGENPIGEVCIRQPGNFREYYKAKALTDEVLEADGWFHSGDVGTITPEGILKLVDRKKNILKLSQGEYVAVEKIEATYKELLSIDQIWVYGNSFKNFLVAIVVPTKDFVEKWAKQNEKELSFEALCKDPDLKANLQSELDATAKQKKLKGFEVVKKIHIESEPFSIEHDLMTPTFKLKRPQLQRKYQQVLDGLYDS